MASSDEIVRAARGCVGAPFRLQGRATAGGLDCVGVVTVAYAGLLSASPPADYPKRGGSAATIGLALAAAGFRPIDIDQASAADLVLLLTGPVQWHLAVLTETGFVHADARLRKVVETPGSPAWPLASAWRIGEGDG